VCRGCSVGVGVGRLTLGVGMSFRVGTVRSVQRGLTGLAGVGSFV